MIRSISALAKKSNLTIASFAPAPPAPNTSPVVTSPLGAPSGVVPSLQTITVTINFSGTYPNVELFLNKLEALKRSFLVTGLQMSGAGGNSTASPKLTVVMQARVFDVSTIGAAPAAAPAASPAATTKPAQ